MSPHDQLRVLDNKTPKPFHSLLDERLVACGIEILQLNVGRRCNLSCRHCHVDAGPDRKEVMGKEVMEACLDVLARNSIPVLDITGGSPEMNPRLEWFLRKASEIQQRILVRSNLVILLEDTYSGYLDLYAELGVEVVGSLPAYNPYLAERQRGKETFLKIIEAIRRLNSKGYAKPGTGLVLDLVHNPVGAFLPGPQHVLEKEYKTRLQTEHGVFFDRLFSLVNCPIGRWLDFLVATENIEDYMLTLVKSYNPETAKRVMCRTTLSVSWDGRLYDCDFNQVLGLPLASGMPQTIFEFDMDRLAHRPIVIANHCYSCTAGAGSSCQGALDCK